MRMSVYERILLQLLGYAARIGDSLGTYRKREKEQIYTLLTDMNNRLFGELVTVNPNGTFFFNRGEGEFVVGLKEIVGELIDTLEPIVQHLAIQSMRKHGLKASEILKFVDNI